MRDRGALLAGVAVFAAAAAFAGWRAASPAGGSDRPALDPPREPGACIEPRSSMAAHHPEILARWRAAVVREGKVRTDAAEGGGVAMSLSGTCLGCHSNKEKFCDSCHLYSGVKPNCWSCHVVPKEART